jgi:type III secretion protein F
MSGSVGGAFNYNQIANTMGNATNGLEANLRSFSQTMDPNSTADLIRLQNLTQQWTMAVDLQSTTIKLVGDTLKGVVQKID